MKHTRGRGKKVVFFPHKASYKLGTDEKRGEQVGFFLPELEPNLPPQILLSELEPNPLPILQILLKNWNLSLSH